MEPRQEGPAHGGAAQKGPAHKGAAQKDTVPGYVLAAVLLSLVLLLPIWVVDYLPTHDGPQHIFGAYLYNHLHDPGAGYDRYFRHNVPITNLGFPVLFATFERILPWKSATALALSVIVLVWSWGFFTLCRALHPQRWLVGMLGFAVALQWALYMGMFSFVLSTGIGFFVIAYALGREEWHPRDYLRLGGLLTLQALAHVFGAMTSGVALGLLFLIAPSNAKRWRHLAWLLLMSLPTLAIGLMARGAATPAATGPSLGERLLLAPALIFAGPAWRCALFAALCAAGLGGGLWTALNKRAKPTESALTLASALFLLAGILLPTNMPGWDYAGPRFLPYGALFALALLPSERLLDQALNVRRAVAGIVAVFLLASFGWQTLYSCNLWQRCADGLAALAAPVKRSGNRLPIILNPDVGLRSQSASALVPFALPLRNFGALFALEQGGHVPYFFAGIAALHPHLRIEKDEQLAPAPSQFLVAPLYGLEPVEPRERSMILNYMLSFAVYYEDVVVSGTAEDVATTLGRGFVPDYQNDTVVIARFKGCPAQLRIDQAPSHPLLVSFGWFPSMEQSAEVRVPASEGAITVDLAQAPCGTIWLRVIADADRSGTLTPGDGTCARAAPDGIFLAALKSQPQVIDCIVRGSP